MCGTKESQSCVVGAWNFVVGAPPFSFFVLASTLHASWLMLCVRCLMLLLFVSCRQMRAIRNGLCTIVCCAPNSLFSTLRCITPRELELRVCGEPTIDLEVLKAHTVYKPKRFTLEVQTALTHPVQQSWLPSRGSIPAVDLFLSFWEWSWGQIRRMTSIFFSKKIRFHVWKKKHCNTFWLYDHKKQVRSTLSFFFCFASVLSQSPFIQQFWRVLHGFGQEDRARYVRFITHTACFSFA